MPARGSAIGASMGSSVFGGTVTGRPASPSTSAMYRASMPGTPKRGSWSAATVTLLLLVLLEAAALLALRHGFRHHHGG